MYYICNLLLLVRISWVLSVFHLVGCKMGLRLSLHASNLGLNVVKVGVLLMVVYFIFLLLLISLTSMLDGGVWSMPHPICFTHRKETPRTRLGCGKSHPLPGFHPCTIRLLKIVYLCV